MGMNFPTSPIVGEFYPVPAVMGLPQYKWDGEKWITQSPSGITSDNSFLGILSIGVAANALNVAVLTMNGQTPSPANPAYYRVPAVGGGYFYRAITAACTLTIPSGATLGVINPNVAFRVWFAIFDDAGTPRLAASQNINTASTATYLIPPSPLHTAVSAVTPPGNNPATFYGNTAVTSKFWTYVGWASWESGLAAVGVWSANPSDVVATLLDNMPRPGDMVRMRAHRATATANNSVATTIFDGTLNMSWNSSSAANPVEVPIGAGTIYLRTGATHGQATCLLRRDAVTLISVSGYSALTGDIIFPWSLAAWDFPNTVGTVAYKWSYQNVQALMVNYTAANLLMKEYMA